MDYDRFSSFLSSLPSPISEELELLYEQAIEDEIPVIRRDTISYLYTLFEIVRPINILELGTAVGFSALCMRYFAKSYTDDASITTIENYEPRIIESKENFVRFKADEITLLEGDATEIVASLNSEYDFIFLDSAKAQYPVILPDLRRLLRSGGILLADNIFSDGDLVESGYLIKRRNRTIHRRMREFIRELYNDDNMATSILPIGDGLLIAKKS